MQDFLTDSAAAAALQRSHERCSAFGLRSDHVPDVCVLEPQELEELQQRNLALGTHARPAMENLYAQIAGTRSMVLLTDRNGTILHSLGDSDFLARAQRVALQPGVVWSEQSRGTNAIGTALAEGEATQIHADEHFLRAHHFLSCSCAPIVDPMGELLGSLDISGDRRSQNRHTLALVRMSAQMVENHLFMRHFGGALQIHFHARPELLGTPLEGMVAFDFTGRFLSANRSAVFQLGMPLRSLQAHTFGSLFGRAASELIQHGRNSAVDLLDLRMTSGFMVAARVLMRRPAASLPPVLACLEERPGASVAASTRPTSRRGLESLRTGDAVMSSLLDRLQRLSGKSIPVLILGETGTGKEMLARALHQDSPRSAGPLVAVNCAALPEQLIESELFGYEEGAFTGARRKGSSGRILQADGGTLFLDEIGDMPLPLQARLLRVLQEREVVPLGAGRPVPVDVAIVCATHRDLRALRATGAFRDDLYWRINGLVVRLPALRERSDLPAIAERLLRVDADLAGEAPPGLAAEVLELFARHPWPGNIRQMASLLRTAAALRLERSDITIDDLPEDFLDDLVGSADALAAHGDSTSLQAVAMSAIDQAMRRNGGNISAAARSLGVARNTVYRRLRAR